MSGYPQMLGNGQWLRIEPADPAVDLIDIVLIMQARADMALAGVTDYDRLAKLVAPYTDATAEQLATIYTEYPEDFDRTMKLIQIRILHERPPT